MTKTAVESFNVDSAFVPVDPLMEKGSILSPSDVDAFLKEHIRSLDGVISEFYKAIPARHMPKLVSTAESVTTLSAYT